MMLESYFFCEALNQRLAKVVCVTMQDRAAVKGSSRARSLYKCRACDQGKEIRKELNEERTSGD